MDPLRFHQNQTSESSMKLQTPDSIVLVQVMNKSNLRIHYIDCESSSYEKRKRKKDMYFFSILPFGYLNLSKGVEEELIVEDDDD